jgi:hypothetical protein
MILGALPLLGSHPASAFILLWDFSTLDLIFVICKVKGPWSNYVRLGLVLPGKSQGS